MNREAEITAQLVRLEDLQVAYEDYKGSSDRVQKGNLGMASSEYLEEEGPFGRAYVATVPGSSLAQLYEQHGNRLFA